jgi:hypothetical protein
MRTALLTGIAFEQFRVRSYTDRRKRVNRIVASFTDSHNSEYRRSFEFPVDMSFDDMRKALPTSIEIN